MRVVALLAGSLIVLLTEVPAGQRTASPPSPDFSPVREFIKTEMGVGTSTPSLAVAVARGNEILWEEGFGWIDHPGGTAATADTLYYGASVTKAITATALMVLHERRQVELDRPANLYLRTAKLRSPHWNADDVTIRHLATHTGGLATYDNRDDIPGNETIGAMGLCLRHREKVSTIPTWASGSSVKSSRMCRVGAFRHSCTTKSSALSPW
jgi:CubicO group peptidase (beta-lactamase class C family)